ncbi:unnamed protein product [Caenorhabditis nigoni]
MDTSPANDVTEDSEQYQVLKIHSMQIEEASYITFLVEWNGYEEKTWEPIECFEGMEGESGEQNPAIQKFLGTGTNMAKYRKMKNDIAKRRSRKLPQSKEELFEISNLRDVRLDKNSEMEFLVEWEGNFENSWQPMSNFPGGEVSNEAITHFLNFENNRKKYEGLKLEIVSIKARKLRKSGVSKVLKNQNRLEKESKKSQDSEDLEIDEILQESDPESGNAKNLKTEDSKTQIDDEVLQESESPESGNAKNQKIENSKIQIDEENSQESEPPESENAKNLNLDDSTIQMNQDIQESESSKSENPEEAKDSDISADQKIPEPIQNLVKIWESISEEKKEKYIDDLMKNDKFICAFVTWSNENVAKFEEKFPEKSKKEIEYKMECFWTWKMSDEMKFPYFLASWNQVIKIE